MSASFLDRITINPEIAHGNPTIRNTRYTVEGMLEYLARGDSIEELLLEFPDFEKDDFQLAAVRCFKYETKDCRN